MLLYGHQIVLKLTGSNELNRTYIFISETFLWVAQLFNYGYCALIEKWGILAYTEIQYDLWKHIKQISAILAVTLALMIPIVLFLNLFGLMKESPRAIEIKRILQANRPLLFYTSFTAAVTEELIFRGYIFSRLDFILQNENKAIVVSSILFGLLHFGYGTIINMVFPMVFGGVLSFYYWKYRNIAIPIISHFLWDFVSFSLTIKPH